MDKTGRRFVDLHTHSDASDGDLPPQEVVRLADAAGMAVVALTDHDTIAGLPAASRAAESLDIQFVNGVEISAKFTGGVLHILGLGIDPNDEVLNKMLDNLREARNERNPKMIAKLQHMGIDITMDELGQFARSMRQEKKQTDEPLIIGRLHMAGLLVKKGYVKSIDEAFERYLGQGKAAYVDKEKLSPFQAIEAIHAAGGLAILAHPIELNCPNIAALETVVRNLMDDGLDGIEVYHSSHDSHQTRMYLDLARRYHLLVSGGSDFHGSAKPGVQIGYPRVPVEAVEQLLVKLTT